MEPFFPYLPGDAVYANLKENALRFGLLGEIEAAHLCEFAAEIFTAVPPAELLSALPDHRLPDLSGAEFPGSVSPWMQNFHTARNLWQTAFLCRALSHLYVKSPGFSLRYLFPDASADPFPAVCRIVYPRNANTDAAFSAFAPFLSGASAEPRAVYTGNFISACEEVAGGFCHCCILPLENAAEGRINSSMRLIDRYELKILSCCQLRRSSDSTGFTRFALLGKQLSLPKVNSGNALFEVSIPAKDPSENTAIPLVAQLCGLRLSFADIRPCAEKTDRSLSYFSFFTCGDLPAFLFYLAMEAPHCTPVGFYAYPDAQTAKNTTNLQKKEL